MHSSSLKNKLENLAERRSKLKARIEVIKAEERELMASCTHVYDDGTDALIKIKRKDYIYAISCDVCKKFIPMHSLKEIVKE